jgi:hypothetical protein
VPADHRRFTLRGTADEKFVGVTGPAARLRHPGDAGVSRG